MAGNIGAGDAPDNSLIRLRGEFVTKHREQLRQLARMTERVATSEGCVGSILSITDGDSEIRIITNSAVLVRRIGDRVSAVCGGTVVDDALENGFRPCLLWSRSDDEQNR